MHASHTKLTTVGDPIRQQPPEKTLGRHSAVPGTRVKGSKENSSTGQILSSSGNFLYSMLSLIALFTLLRNTLLYSVQITYYKPESRLAWDISARCTGIEI